MLRVKGALDACRLQPVLRDGYVDNDALHVAVGRCSSANLGHLRVHADTLFSFPGAASNFDASSEYDRKRGRHHVQGSLGGTSPGALQNRC